MKHRARVDELAYYIHNIWTKMPLFLGHNYVLYIYIYIYILKGLNNNNNNNSYLN